MEPRKVVVKEYMCSWCGRKVRKQSVFGRPDPGICPKRSSSNRQRPHVWVVNRVISK